MKRCIKGCAVKASPVGSYMTISEFCRRHPLANQVVRTYDDQNIGLFCFALRQEEKVRGLGPKTIS
jgi:hypothetical protein